MSRHQKTGHQSADNPLKFVMSTSSIDKMGDTVVQDWNLKDFKKNPIALWNHNSNFPIGTWEKVAVEGGKLVGQLKLAKEGTSRLVNELRSLVEQRVLRAVSVGFQAGHEAPIEGTRGYTLSKNTLMECSLVSVPANGQALLATKSLSPELQKLLTQASASSPVTQHTHRKSNTMNLSEMIQAKRVAIQTINDSIEDLKNNPDMTADEMETYSSLLDDRETATKTLDLLERDEKAMATRAVPVPNADPAPLKMYHAGTGHEKGHLLFGALGNMLKAHITNQRADDVCSDSYKNDKAMAEMTKAVSAPAMTTVPGWAQELVQEGYGEFLALLKPVSVYAQMPGGRHVFGANGKIHVPTRDGTKKLNGDFVAEGAPIPVKQLSLKSAMLTPKKLGVISTYTREIAIHSTPQIEGIIRQAMLDDTAEVLDTVFLDNVAGTAIRPAGLKKIADTNTSASSGTTAAQILADIKIAVDALVAANLGNNAVWVMNPTHRLGLSGVMLANGAFLFRDEVNAGSFAGFPVIVSNNVPKGDVFLVDAQALTFANDFGPEFEVSNQATLHMEDDVTKVSPIVDTGSGTAGATDLADIANPVRSLFQTDTYGLRMVWGLDWAEMRAGGVYVLTSVAW